jgi:acyl dehydratase
MRFEEFRAGQVLKLGPIRVEESDIIAFAKAYDPQWFHTDPERAQASRWRGLIASGWHTCAIAMRLICEGPLKDSESIGSPGLTYVKWPAPVRPGDELRLEAEVILARVSSSGRVGILSWRWRLCNQDQETVLDLEAVSLFERVVQKGGVDRSLDL